MSPHRRAARALSQRLGRRSACLLIFGIMWVAYGISLEIAPIPESPGAVLLHEMLPTWARVGLWVGSGLLAVFAGLRRPPIWQAAAFSGLMLPVGLRAISHLWAWVVYLLPVGAMGDPRGWASAIFYGAFVVLVVIVAGWRDPQPDLRHILDPTVPL